jgi:cytochrome c2
MRNLYSGAAVILTLTLAAPAAFSQSKGDPKQGKAVFEQCALCHHADSAQKKMGPGLKGLFKRAKLADGKPVNDATVIERVNKGGNGMPAYAKLLSKEDKDNLIAYLKTL